MDTLWSCVITVVVLCFIGILLWLLLRKHTAFSKKLKGSGIKMKGGGPVEVLQQAIDILIKEQLYLLKQSLSMSPTNTALLLKYNELSDQQKRICMEMTAPLAHDVVNTALVIFSEWLSAVRNGVSIYENIGSTVTVLVTAAMQSGVEFIKVPVLSACMKSPGAFEIANRLKGTSAVVTFYRERINTDYLARSFFIFTGIDIGDIIIIDINNSGNAIKHVLGSLANIEAMEAARGIANYIINNVRGIIGRFNHPISMKTLVSCLTYIYNLLKRTDASENAVTAVNNIYNTADPDIAWLCADEICDIDGFQLRGDMINTEVFYRLATKYPGEVDFEYITNHNSVSTEMKNRIVLAQIMAFCSVPSRGDINDIEKLKLCYEIASNLVQPITG